MMTIRNNLRTSATDQWGRRAAARAGLWVLS